LKDPSKSADHSFLYQTVSGGEWFDEFISFRGPGRIARVTGYRIWLESSWNTHQFEYHWG
jgi:hypothetical protein